MLMFTIEAFEYCHEVNAKNYAYINKVTSKEYTYLSIFWNSLEGLNLLFEAHIPQVLFHFLIQCIV